MSFYVLSPSEAASFFGVPLQSLPQVQSLPERPSRTPSCSSSIEHFCLPPKGITFLTGRSLRVAPPLVALLGQLGKWLFLLFIIVEHFSAQRSLLLIGAPPARPVSRLPPLFEAVPRPYFLFLWADDGSDVFPSFKVQAGLSGSGSPIARIYPSSLLRRGFSSWRFFLSFLPPLEPEK